MTPNIIRRIWFLLLSVIAIDTIAVTDPTDSTKNISRVSDNTHLILDDDIELGSLRSFESLNTSVDLFDFDQDLMIPSNYEDTTVSAAISAFRARAQALFAEVENARRYVDFLDETSLLELPVGIKKTIGNIDYSILVDSMVLTPTHAYLTAYMVFTLPSSGRTIAFRGSGLKFSKKGGIDPDAKLQLLGDYAIPFNEETLLVLKGEGNTFVEFDCDGFRSMGIEADVLFSRDVFLPDTPSGEAGTGRVQSRFSTVLTDWNNFLVELTMPDFQIKGMEGVGFSVNGAVFDFSDYRNSASMRFPSNYLATGGISDNSELWRGFYLRDIVVSLPPQFNKKGANTRTTFSGKDLIIDKSGFTGHLEAENLIQRSEGDIDGWAFSLSQISLDFESSQLAAGGFQGDIVIPVSKENQPFEYSALIYPGSEYVFSVSNPETLDFDIFQTSEVVLFPNSSIEIKISDGKFLPKANLYGTMDIGGGDVTLADIQFENLQIQSVKPYLKADYFSFGSEAAEQAMSGFPVQITNVGLRNISDTKTGLDVDVLLNVTETFSGESGLTFVGERTIDERPKWNFKRLDVNDVSLDIKTAAFDFYGHLAVYKEDAVYGDGFNGSLSANFKKISIQVDAQAIFGNVDGYRYWYVDAAASFGKGIPVSPGIEITGFGGGAYYGMGIGSSGDGSDLGRTQSGITYIPKENYGLGFKASVEFASASGTSFNGDAALEMAFYKGGGLRYISFKGNAYFMTPPASGALAKIQEKAQKLGDAVAKLEQQAGAAGALICETNADDQTLTNIYGEIGEVSGEEGAISAHVFISMDFENQVLHGNFEVYINVSGGIIQGIGNGGRAGWAVLHFAPDDWYIYIGTPNDRLGVKLGVGPISAEANGYFMVGTSIPGSPPPPEEVSSILGGMDLDYMDDLNELGNGSGFAFGAAFKVDTGDMRFLMFYARFKAGAGFDIMLKDYGDSKCAGSNKPLGINGWYANGQAYAYFEGKVGIRVKIFGKKKSIDILNIGAAAILQAKLPNPFWMRGVVGGKFSVLGGLVKGQCKFQVTLGEDCELQVEGSVLENLTVIADVTPRDGESDVNVFATPQAVFNLQVEKEFEMMDVDDKLKRFRIKLDHFKLMEESRSIAGELEWNADHDVLAFNSDDIFGSKKEIMAEVQVSFEERRSGNWMAVVVDGKKYVEARSIKFKSGTAPDHIPLSNVEFCYPSVNQLNFYASEHNRGYIKLKKGQPDLFNMGSEWNQKGRFVSSAGQDVQFEFAYSAGNKQLNYTLPSGLNSNMIYTFDIVNLPAAASGSIDRNVSSTSKKVENSDTQVRTRKAEG
ncbi:MAG: hypothetical protein GY816_04185, partial [Cytophagales bacterium]|nr:hypothetical protein [Cytophagales bacterium]